MDMDGKKILVCLSGGVDSSVAAALLVRQGYDVTGAYMINYEENSTESSLPGADLAESCWVPDYRDALRVAAKLGMPLLKLDFKKEYNEYVLDYMYAEYKKGRTPNPDVMCNKYIKFGFWLKKAHELGFDYLATGHYANVARITKHVPRTIRDEQDGSPELVRDMCYVLRVATDENKDQTYFLHQLNQEQLSHTLFPLGDYTKPEVRELAEKFDLPTAKKEESMGICFVGEVPMEEFLKKKIASTPGNIIFSKTGDILGTHDGLAFYTIGQRHLGVVEGRGKGDVERGDNKPLYVVAKDFDKNELIVGFDDDPLLYTKEILVEDMHWISGHAPNFPLQCEVRLRHRQSLQRAVISEQGTIVCDEPQRAVTPGQFAVVYKDGVCLGGGVIH